MISTVFGDFGSDVVPIEFQTIAGNSSSAITQPRFVVIRNIFDWESLWREHTGNVTPLPSLPQINFHQNMVIAVFLGNRPSSCYSVAVERVTLFRDPDRIEVEFREFAPPVGLLCATVITNPSALIVTPYFSESVQFGRLN
ncbi:MAG: protease complex subunit PrcB family protein [Burkholderiales bacterium]|nr:protease complex subunit PrcB family protein [Burkholderiales bacterium]